jgi:hypothetical protein
MSDYICRIHPAINIARVGNSDEYYIAPETMAALPIPGLASPATGGLPIRPDTESDTITSSDLRDENGAFKRQAARFKIYQYTPQPREAYPNGGGMEISIGSKVDGKQVADIIWTVHLANKKANCYVLENPNLPDNALIIEGYENGKLPPLRNLSEGSDATDHARLRKLTIDPGPRTIMGTASGADNAVKFDKETGASFSDGGTGITPSANYPKSFPDDSFSDLYCPTGNLDTLGELQTDKEGRLLVLGGYGRACAWHNEAAVPSPLGDDVDNDGWFDDTSDGPVSAVLVFDDGSHEQVAGAWVVATDPSYAPQTLNVVSLWDDIYDSWVRKLQLSPEIFESPAFVDSYKPYFENQVYPIFRAAAMQQWNTSLPPVAISSHQIVGGIQATDNPNDTILDGLSMIRNPNIPTQSGESGLMPLSLGDSGRAFLSVTLTQYFFLSQWNNGLAFFQSGSGPQLGPGEYLDKAVLVNCLGGRFSPGIDMTFVVRQPELYIENWQTSGTGPFRIHPATLDYNKAKRGQPFLTVGYVPIHSGGGGLEPGDASKFMALPWHTDYNSCGTHPTDPNPNKDKTLYWSWPAQRPVSVYLATDVLPDGQTLGAQRYSVRGNGTQTDDQANAGRYQDRIDMVKNWSRIGVVIQGSAIDIQLATGVQPYSPDLYLEVGSQLDELDADPWPIFTTRLS